MTEERSEERAEGKAERILVIDDDTTQRILVKEYLEDAGYSVRLSDDGSRGLKMAAKFKPDLIILDWMLPSLDGYTLCTCLKQNEVTAEIPIILITASRDRDVIERGLSAGADDFVTKPVDWVFLADRVANVLGKTRQQAAIARQLQSFRRTEEDTARQLAMQAEQVQQEFDKRIRELEEEALKEIKAVQDAARSEIVLTEQKYTARIEEMQLEHQLALANQAKAAQAKYEALEAGLTKRIEAAVASACEKSGIAVTEAESRLADSQRAFADQIKSCWNLVRVASNHHRDLAFRLTAEAQAIASIPGLAEDLPDLATALQNLSAQARALSDSIGSLNLLAQVTSGKVEVKTSAVDLKKLISGAVQRFKPVCEQSRVSIRCLLPSSDLEVNADEARLTYALSSLLINATRFTPPGGEIAVSIGETPEGNVRLAVSDTGIGIGAAQLENLNNCLDRPWSALTTDRSGVGYGIPIATALARQHGGSLEIESLPGRGTTAILVLPAQIRRVNPAAGNGSLFRNAS
jgi:DNA-binding response OmpR family regulator